MNFSYIWQEFYFFSARNIWPAKTQILLLLLSLSLFCSNSLCPPYHNIGKKWGKGQTRGKNIAPVPTLCTISINKYVANIMLGVFVTCWLLKDGKMKFCNLIFLMNFEFWVCQKRNYFLIRLCLMNVIFFTLFPQIIWIAFSWTWCLHLP
jgi:hypothetical protein